MHLFDTPLRLDPWPERGQGPGVGPECRVQEATQKRGDQHEQRDAARRPPELGALRPLWLD